MKTNGNNKKTSDYCIGLDIGTNSVGWAVTDENYNVLKFKGNAMWGVRLFEPANDATERRGNREARRALARKKQRLELLEMLFNDEIAKIDPSFFIRLHESSLFAEDKTDKKCRYSLFNDKDFTDKDYLKKYPTVYHLRDELIKNDGFHDPRLVFLALHHIVKNRGHFLFESESGDNYKNISEILDELNFLLNERFDTELSFKDRENFIKSLIDNSLNITAKKKALKNCVLIGKGEDDSVNMDCLVQALSGSTVKLCNLFNDEQLKNAETSSICLKNDLDEKLSALSDELGDRVDLIVSLKAVFDSARLAQILKNHEYISEAKIEMFEQNKSDLKMLKAYVKENRPSEYKRIFSQKSKDLKNFSAYGRRNLESGDSPCSQEDFCKFLLKELPDLAADEKYREIYEKIKANEFLPKLRSSDNSVIPIQLHLKELKKILENSSKYLPFLNETDSEGISVKEKIISIFKFRIPYYVGPLNASSEKAWLVRKDEKIYPWNFDRVVDIEKSAENFIINLINRCSYTGEYVLPKDSLLYSEYCVLNEINTIKVNGNLIPVDVKKRIYNDLFVKSKSKLTKKGVKKYLMSLGLVKEEDKISGIDDTVKSKLNSYHDFKKILDKTGDKEMVEEIIQRILVFGDDKKLLRNWLRKNCKALDENDISYVCRLRYKDWGRLSKKFLTEIYSADENGEAHSIIEMLRETNCNLNQLLSDEYQFAENAKAYLDEKYPVKEGIKSQIEDMYVPTLVKRSILQAMKIIDEIVDIKKSAPKKIFVEVTRGTLDNKKERTKSRKEKLIELYKACKIDSGELYESLEKTEESKLRHDALYLYYTQMGKCMYTGEKIEIEEIDKNYDVDHIFPQSKIIDDSLDNRVLVKRKYNEDKGNNYPINNSWRQNMSGYWKILLDKGLISEKKYERLTRNYPLTAEELSSFVQRQLVETAQSTKAVAQLLTENYPETKIVYSKANNVSRFKNDFGFVKCRELNDFHHAKDAYLNIVVGNVYDTKFTEKFFFYLKNRGPKEDDEKYEYSLNKVFDYDVKGAWDKTESIKTVKKYMSKNNIIVSRRAHETKGALYDVQIMPAGKGQLPIKIGKEIEKYGGYNKISGAYFFAVEHQGKKKRRRSIEPVYIYEKSLYEKDPIKYCEEVLGLEEPKIICPKILFDQQLNVDGKNLFVTGRFNNYLSCKHNYQLVLDPEYEKYLKAMLKYVESCRNAQRELPISLRKFKDKEYVELSCEKNIQLYNVLADKIQQPVYKRLLDSASNVILKGGEKFASLSLLKQCELLEQMLKLFKCDRQTADLTLIGGLKNSGSIYINKTLDKVSSAVLINKSVTGLFETRVDLLK